MRGRRWRKKEERERKRKSGRGYVGDGKKRRKKKEKRKRGEVYVGGGEKRKEGNMLRVYRRRIEKKMRKVGILKVVKK